MLVKLKLRTGHRHATLTMPYLRVVCQAYGWQAYG